MVLPLGGGDEELGCASALAGVFIGLCPWRWRSGSPREGVGVWLALGLAYDRAMVGVWDRTVVVWWSSAPAFPPYPGSLCLGIKQRVVGSFMGRKKVKVGRLAAGSCRSGHLGAKRRPIGWHGAMRGLHAETATADDLYL